MSFNGSGTFLINTAGQPVVSGTVISSTAFNSLTADLATGLSTAITKDGQTTVTANIPMSTYKFTGLGVGSAATDSANLSQVQSTVTKLLNSVSGADTITATASPTLAAYAAGQMFYFVAAGDNTTSVTLNIDSLGAKAVTRDGSVALAAADVKSGEVVVVVYDGTRFQVVSQLNSAGDARFANVSIASSLYVGGVSTFVGNAGFSANVSIASALSVGGVAAITGATTIGGNLTLSGGTANGVAYLDGSKVVTSGSVLTFDGTNLRVGGSGSGSRFVVRGTGTTSATFSIEAATSGGATRFLIADDGLCRWFGTSNAETMRLDNAGNLGIGTASPAAKLDVVGAIRATTNISAVQDFRLNNASFYRVADASPGGFVGGYNIKSDGGTGAVYDSTGTTGGYGVYLGTLTWYSGTSAAAGTAAPERMRLDSSGNLGIGTTSPGQRLAVRSADNVGATNIARFESNNAAQGVVVRFASVLGDGGNTTFGTLTNNATLIAVNNSEVARFDTSGNLGIGTASPGARLHVAGESRFGLGAEAVRAAIGSAFAAGQGELFTASTNSMGVGTAGAANLNFYSNSVLRMIIDSNGNVRTNTGALTTTATDGFLYVPTCAGTPTGTPTAITGMAPIVVNTTNNKLYFYSGGAWRDAGP